MELLMGLGQAEKGGTTSTESSPGLRFGQKIYFEDGSGSGSKNRVGTYQKSTKIVRCQVEDCKMDLSNVKAYYLRHKVCSIHSKSSKVVVSGLHQRFCQQCSRFHQLSEFDFEKRSCRRRLACHNERRRKPQATTVFTSPYTRLVAPSGRANTAMFKSVLCDPMEWPTARSRPWQSHQQLMNVVSQGSSSFSITCQANYSTDSSCALSLLSNSNSSLTQQQQQLQTQVNIWRPSSGLDSMAQPPSSSSHHQYLNQRWEFMSGDKSNSHYMSPVLGQSHNDTIMDGYELPLLHQQVLRQYMEPENGRDYESTPQHFNWSL